MLHPIQKNVKRMSTSASFIFLVIFVKQMSRSVSLNCETDVDFRFYNFFCYFCETDVDIRFYNFFGYFFEMDIEIHFVKL